MSVHVDLLLDGLNAECSFPEYSGGTQMDNSILLNGLDDCPRVSLIESCPWALIIGFPTSLAAPVLPTVSCMQLDAASFQPRSTHAEQADDQD